VAALLGIVAAFFLWGLPAISAAIASLVPVSVEERLGAVVLEGMAPQLQRCRDDAVERIAAALQRASPASPYRFRVYVVNDGEVNAFAAPGGFIGVHRGLIEKTGSPEELAAVLAHEMQHVVQRHSTKGMMRGLTFLAVLSAALGDAGGAAAQVMGTLGQLHYNRRDESSADREGLRMLEHARIDPRAMVRMLRILEALAGDGPAMLRYLSTHPLPSDRITEMERLAAEAHYAHAPVLAGVRWPPPAADCRP